MSEQKANQKPMFKMPAERLQRFTSLSDPKQLEEFVLKACEHYRKFLQRQKDRER